MLFIGTFFICLFIFMMQFLWRYVDELVGKGLEMSVLAQFFFYSALTLIPLSLPLAILLAALMTFGNFGERYELLSMKAAGIPLLRIIRPLIIFCTFLCCTSFYFQNVIAPKAQIKLLTLLVSMKQTSPELDIPEGVFYDEIEGYNIYVKQKDRETGMLKDVLIYNFSDGFENAHIIWASEGKMEMTADKQHLYLHLYNGEQFENLKSQTISSNNVPYRRETFREKHTIIEFDGGFNMVDGSFLSDRSDSKNMIEISQSIDSLNHRADSLGRSMYNEIKASTYRNIVLSKTDSAKIVETNNKINVDSLFNSYTLAEKDKTLGSAADRTEALASEWSMKSYQTTDADNNIRKHEADWHKKITLSLSCLIFFFLSDLGTDHLHSTRQQLPLRFFHYAVLQCFRRIIRQYIHSLLQNNFSAIRNFIDKMDGSTGNFHPVIKRRLVHTQSIKAFATKRRNEGRMDIDDTAREHRSKTFAQNAHKSGQNNQFHMCFHQGFHDMRLKCPLRTALVLRNGDRGNLCTRRSC